uniref:Uncharacterized protein n=1 Tax=Fagus sylvatica TaxID=28930 RepID=A0A2N9FPM3_FAGSY
MAGNEHVISMEEFHSRYSVRRVTGETSSSAADEAETKSIQIQTTTLEARVQTIREAKENVNNKSHLIPKIQKVIFFLRDEKDLTKYYEPRVVSLGPIHHRNPKYQLGEQYKLLLTYEFVKGSEKMINDLYEKIKEKIKDLRDCFKREVTVDYDDEELAWLVAFGQQDLFLLENQLPYRLLKWLMSWSENEDELKDSIERYIQRQVIVREEGKREKEESCDSKEKPQEQKTISVDPGSEHIHLLDYLRTSLLDKRIDKINQNKQIQPWQSYRNVEELRAAGILMECSKSKKCCLSDISFTTRACLGYLILPPIIVDDSTRPMFLNLIAYEMCLDFENDFGVTSYISFLDSLIDERNDVKMLRKAGVLYNCLGSDKEVAKLFNEIGTDLVPNTQIYSNVRLQIQEHYKNKWMTWMAQFYQNHFSSPWTIFAFCGVLVGLGLTGIQTWLAVHPAK